MSSGTTAQTRITVGDILHAIRWPMYISAATLVLTGYLSGINVAITALLLTLLEISVSFDNATVNALIVDKLNKT